MGEKKQSSDKLIIWGIVSTVLYFFVVLAICWGSYRSATESENITNSFSNIGSFVSGIFSPLALGWLIIGFLLQRNEMKNTTEALMTQVKAIRTQTTMIKRAITPVIEWLEVEDMRKNYGGKSDEIRAKFVITNGIARELVFSESDKTVIESFSNLKEGEVREILVPTRLYHSNGDLQNFCATVIDIYDDREERRFIYKDGQIKRVVEI